MIATSFFEIHIKIIYKLNENRSKTVIFAVINPEIDF